MSLKEKFVSPIVVTVLLLLGWIYTPLGSIPMTFIKMDSVKQPFTVAFFSIMLISIYYLGPKLAGMAWPRKLVVTAILGHLISIASLIIADLAVPDGIDRFLNGFHGIGILQPILAFVSFPALLGGWLILPVALFWYTLANKYILANEVKKTETK